MIQSWKEGSRGTQILKASALRDGNICTSLIHEKSQSVFVATDRNIINQVNLRSRKIVKKYLDLGIGSIFCLSSLDTLLCVGGENCRFVLIDILKKRFLMFEYLKMPRKWFDCSRFTIIKQNNHPAVALIFIGSKLLSYLVFQFKIESFPMII